MTQLRAFIFDVDGTLADTERDGHRVAFNYAFQDAGLEWHWDTELYGRLLAVGGGKERIKYYCDNFIADPDVQAYWTPEKIRELHETKTTHYTDLLDRGEIPLRPGIERVIEEARRHGVRLAIASTTTPVNVTTLLANSFGEEAPAWFEVIAAGDDVPAKKPAPDIYFLTLEKMGLSPCACLAFEDSQSGLRAARAAGLKTVVTVTEYTRWQDLGAADLVVDHLGESTLPFQLLPSNEDYNRARESVGDATMFDLALGERLLAA